jgi:hypothetical protein
MGQQAVVLVDIESDESTDSRNGVQRMQEQPLMLRERHHASIIELENLSSV